MMADRPIRVGQVSAVDYETGMIRVVFNDMDSAVSALIPYATLGNEYHMPEVGEYVLSLHMNNGQEAGLVLGTYWNQQHTPPAVGYDLFRKDFSNYTGSCYFERDPDPEVLLTRLVVDTVFQVLVGLDIQVMTSKPMSLQGSEIVFTCASGSATLSEIIQHIRSH